MLLDFGFIYDTFCFASEWLGGVSRSYLSFIILSSFKKRYHIDNLHELETTYSLFVQTYVLFLCSLYIVVSLLYSIV